MNEMNDLVGEKIKKMGFPGFSRGSLPPIFPDWSDGKSVNHIPT